MAETRPAQPPPPAHVTPRFFLRLPLFALVVGHWTLVLSHPPLALAAPASPDIAPSAWDLVHLSLVTPSFALALPLDLWPGTPPGPARELPPEGDTTTPADPLVAGRPIIRLGNVATPQITIHRPPAAIDTGTSVIICPGGGFHILAYDIEGTEIAAWLNTLGVTGIVLKYRVPAAPGPDRGQLALIDLRRALGLVHENAPSWGLDPRRIGVIGFSAGGVAAALATLDAAPSPVDPRPAFALLIYTGGWARPDLPALRDGLAVTTATPPLFITQAGDDPYSKLHDAVVLAEAARAAGRPAALHLFATGGHGYGLRPGASPAARWSDLAADWMKSQGLLNP